ncbi:MAG TPA: hypothetical protein VH253_11525 [Phycisphaerae bacterium]|nr:hypothetical protein [Phycisphaerae bacterium]
MKMVHILLGGVLLAAIGGAVWTTLPQRDTLSDASQPYRPQSRPHVVSPTDQARAQFHALHPQIPPLKNLASTDQAHQHYVNRVAFSPDGSRLASAGAEGDLCTWSLPDLQPLLHIHTHAGVIHGLAWSPDSRRLVSGGDDTWINVWDSTTGQLLDRHKQPCPVAAVCFIADNDHLVSTCGQAVRFWQVGAEDQLFAGEPDTESDFQYLAVTPDNQIAVANATGGLFLLDAQGSTLDHLERHTRHVAGSARSADDERNTVTGIRALADGRLLVCDCSGVWLWDRHKDGPAAMELVVPGEQAWHAALTGDGRTLLVEVPTRCRVIDLQSRKTIADAVVSGETLRSVDVDPRGRWFATGSGGFNTATGIEDRGPASLQLFDLKAAQALPPSRDQPKPVDTRDLQPWR